MDAGAAVKMLEGKVLDAVNASGLHPVVGCGWCCSTSCTRWKTRSANWQQPQKRRCPMAEEIPKYRSSLTGPELDEALRNIGQVADAVERTEAAAQTASSTARSWSRTSPQSRPSRTTSM